jgi:CBS domain-containing protein
MLRVADLMTPDPLTIDADTTLQDAVFELDAELASGAPVSDRTKQLASSRPWTWCARSPAARTSTEIRDAHGVLSAPCRALAKSMSARTPSCALNATAGGPASPVATSRQNSKYASAAA